MGLLTAAEATSVAVIVYSERDREESSETCSGPAFDTATGVTEGHDHLGLETVDLVADGPADLVGGQRRRDNADARADVGLGDGSSGSIAVIAGDPLHRAVGVEIGGRLAAAETAVPPPRMTILPGFRRSRSAATTGEMESGLTNNTGARRVLRGAACERVRVVDPAGDIGHVDPRCQRLLRHQRRGCVAVVPADH